MAPLVQKHIPEPYVSLSFKGDLAEVAELS